MEEEGSIKVKFKASLNEQLLIFQIFLRCFIIAVDSSPIAFLGVICEFESTVMKHKVSGWKMGEEKIVTPSFSPLANTYLLLDLRCTTWKSLMRTLCEEMHRVCH